MSGRNREAVEASGQLSLLSVVPDHRAQESFRELKASLLIAVAVLLAGCGPALAERHAAPTAFTSRCDTPDIDTEESEEDDDEGIADEAGDDTSGDESDEEQDEADDGEGDNESEGASDDDSDAGKRSDGIEREPRLDSEEMDDFRDLDLDYEGREIMPRELVVVDADSDALERLQEEGFEIARREPMAGLGLTMVTLRVPEDDDLDEAIDRVRRYVAADAVDYNHVYRAAASARPMPAHGETPHALAVLLDLAPANKKGSDAPFRLGLIDTEVDTGHPALHRTKISGRNFTRTTDTGPSTHGTAVAALLAGREDGRFAGLAPEAQLLVAGVFERSVRGGPIASVDAIVRAFDWLASEHVTVINISLAGPPNLLLEKAVGRVLKRGSVVVAAAGNDGPAAPPSYPAAYEGVIAVTAVGSDLRVYRRAGRGAHLDFAAPGVNILTAGRDGQYISVSGTSYAAPFVSVLLARQLNTTNSLAPGQVVESFRSGTRDLGRPGFDHVYGHGLIQALQPVEENVR